MVRFIPAIATVLGVFLLSVVITGRERSSGLWFIDGRAAFTGLADAADQSGSPSTPRPTPWRPPRLGDPGPSLPGVEPNLLAPFLPVQAVDHVARYRTTKAVVSEYEREFVRTRAHGWVREDGRYADGNTIFADLNTNEDVNVTTDQAGRVTALHANKRPWRRVDDSVRGNPSGERQTFIGETCEIWIWEALPTRYDSTHRNCLTEDGVELWYERSYRDRLSERVEAISITRRGTPLAQMRPDPSLFAWETWAPYAGSESSIGDYELRLEESRSMQNEEGGGEIVIVHRRGQALRRDEHRPDRSRSITFDAQGLSLRFSEGPDGADAELSISIKNPPRAALPTAYGEPVAGRAPTRLLGETCSWFTGSTSHSVAFWCLTADGVTLISDYQGDGVRGGRPRRLDAISLRRGALPASAMTPPRFVFDSWR